MLAGIIKKTKNFKIGNLSPKTLLAGSELISFGAKRDDIIKNLFYSKSFDSLKAWGELLNKLKSENNDEFLWSRLDNESSDFQMSSLDEMVDELIGSLPKAKYFAVIKRVSNDKSMLRFFSLNGASALELLKDYKATGNHEVAEINLDCDLNTAANKTISEIKIKLKKLSS